MSWRRLAATERHQVRLELAVGFPLIHPLAFMSLESDLQAFFQKPLLDSVYFHGADLEDISDVLLPQSARLLDIFIAVQQYQGVEDFLGAVLPFCHDGLKFVSFLRGQRQSILDFGHGAPPFIEGTIPCKF